MHKLTIEQELEVLSVVLKENDLFRANQTVEWAIAAITTLRERVDELGGYHDDV
jgi:hypothetical protein